MKQSQPKDIPLQNGLYGTRPHWYLSKVTRAEVAQLVERGPEKAGVGGSTPSLGINLFKNLQTSFVLQRNPLRHFADSCYF